MVVPISGRIRDDRQAVANAHGGASRNASRNRVSCVEFRDSLRDDPGMARTNTVRIGYARVSGRSQDHQLQLDALDALDAADCREVIMETASTRGDRP